jgi:hypothetical protein
MVRARPKESGVYPDEETIRASFEKVLVRIDLGASHVREVPELNEASAAAQVSEAFGHR